MQVPSSGSTLDEPQPSQRLLPVVFALDSPLHIGCDRFPIEVAEAAAASDFVAAVGSGIAAVAAVAAELGSHQTVISRAFDTLAVLEKRRPQADLPNSLQCFFEASTQHHSSRF